MKNFLITVLVLVYSTSIFSQEIFQVNNLTITNSFKGVLTIEKYQNDELHKNKKCNYKINTVEQKFCNFFNLKTKEGLIAFFSPYDVPSSYSKEDYLEKMKIYDKDKNYYQLDSKYIFDYGISKDIFIKYINYNVVFPKPLYSANYLQDFNNKLALKEMGENFEIGLFLINSNTNKSINYLNTIKDKEIDITTFCNNLSDNIKNKSNKNSLNDLIDKKYSPFINEDIKESTTKEDLTQNKFTYNYKKKFNDLMSGVVIKKNKIPKKDISEKYKIPIEVLVKDSLSVKEVININTMNNDFTIIKFYDSKPIVKTKLEVISNDLIAKNYSLLTILSRLNLEVFVDLYVNKSSKKYNEINKYQSLFKDENGVLDIYKLAEIIEKNKVTLSKYLDE